VQRAGESGKPAQADVKTTPEIDGADAVAVPDREDATTAIDGGEVAARPDSRRDA